MIITLILGDKKDKLDNYLANNCFSHHSQYIYFFFFSRLQNKNPFFFQKKKTNNGCMY